MPVAEVRLGPHMYQRTVWPGCRLRSSCRRICRISLWAKDQARSARRGAGRGKRLLRSRRPGARARANHAPHTIAAAACATTHAPATTSNDASPKRYIVRDVHTALRADFAALTT
ncbi:hypothetical protein GCM10027186_00520 [Micromonospora schwarzwaldensis]